MNDQIDERRPTGFMRLFGQMVMLPVTVFVQSMELVIKTIQGMQRAADNGLEAMVDSGPAMATTSEDNSVDLSEASNSETCGTTKNVATAPKEKTNMTDKDLSNKDMLKLVRYKILFIKRDYEVAFPEKEELVSDSMDDSGYTAWKVAQFIQDLANGDTKVPPKWNGYPENENRKPPAPPYAQGDILLGLPEEDKKYLRVYFEVLDRYEREKPKYKKQQIDVLKEIRDRI